MENNIRDHCNCKCHTEYVGTCDFCNCYGYKHVCETQGYSSPMFANHVKFNSDPSVNFIQVDMNSMFFSDLDQIIQYVKYLISNERYKKSPRGMDIDISTVSLDELLLSLENSKKNGYVLMQQYKPVDCDYYFFNFTETLLGYKLSNLHQKIKIKNAHFNEEKLTLTIHKKDLLDNDPHVNDLVYLNDIFYTITSFHFFNDESSYGIFYLSEMTKKN